MSSQEQNFLSKIPEERSRILHQAVEEIKQKVKEVRPPFAIVIYGSGIYGYNPNEVGKLDDLDILAISPRKHNLLSVLGSLRRLGLELTDDLALVSLSKKFEGGKIDFFRIKGIYQDIPASVHFFAHEVLARGHSPTSAFKPVYGGLTEHQAEKKDREQVLRTEIDFNSVHHAIKYTLTGVKNDFDSTKYTTAISRKTLPDGTKTTPTVGVQAEKMLDGQFIYEPKINNEPTMHIESLLEKYWRTFVRTALFYRPNATNDEIISLLARSPRFSTEFRQQLNLKIDAERQRLEEQVKN